MEDAIHVEDAVGQDVQDDVQDDVRFEDGVLPEIEAPAHAFDPLLGEDADTRFLLMVMRWIVRGRFGYVELAELMTFLFASSVDFTSITLRSVPMFKRFDQEKQESRSTGRWKCQEVGAEMKIPFRYRAGKEAVEALYAEATNFEGGDFEWVPKHATRNDERLYSTPATGKWWASTQVSDDCVVGFVIPCGHIDLSPC